MADPAELIMHHGLAVANYERSPTKENGTILHATEKALLAALAKTAPEGWRLVPETPTQKMIDDGTVHVPWDDIHSTMNSQREAASDVYAAMLAAAPKVPT